MAGSSSITAGTSRRGDPAAPLRAHLLGPTRVVLEERILSDEPWSRRTGRTLLLLLLSTPDHRLPRERVLDTLWPEADPESAANSLHMSVHALRRTLEPDLRPGQPSAYVEVRGGSVALRLVPDLFVDVDAFRAAIALGCHDRARTLGGTARGDRALGGRLPRR